MERSQIAEIVHSLPRGRTVYRYFRDRYALQLLQYCVGPGRPVADVKRTRFSRLLRKEVVRALLARTPDGVLDAEGLECVWPSDAQAFRLTLGTWGDPRRWEPDWDQTCRPGQSLVLQLNFCASHERLYRRLLRPRWAHPFQPGDHPTSRRHITLAWARLDVDLAAGDALIEEIQQDWILMARDFAIGLEFRYGEASRREWFGRTFGDGTLSPLRLGYYLESLRPYERVWDEAMLSAAIWFLRRELGVRRIWYYSFEGGRRLKHIREPAPPRSLYTDLPRRFCFESTRDVPEFLWKHSNRVVRRMIRRREIDWFRLEL